MCFAKTRRLNPLLTKGFGFLLRKNKEAKSSPRQRGSDFPSENKEDYKWSMQTEK